MRRDFGVVLGLGLAVWGCSGKSSGGAASPGGSTPFHALAVVAGDPGGTGNVDGIGAAASFDGVAGLASDGAGNVYAADAVNDTIRKVVLATGAVTTIAGSPRAPGTADGKGAAARFDEPRGLAFDAGNLYVADSGNGIIRKIVLATGMVTTIAGSAGAGGRVDGVGAAAQFSRPQGIASDGAGNLYVADTYNDVVRQIVLATGAVTTVPGASDGLPDSVVSDGAGSLYVAGLGGATVSKIDLATGASTSLSTGATPSSAGATGLAIDRAGSLYFSDGHAALFKLDLASGAATKVAGTEGTGNGASPIFSAPSGLALDGAGNIYVADGGAVIRKVALATSAVTTLAGSTVAGGSADGVGAAASFNGAAGLALDGAGNLYVADQGNGAVRKITLATGAVTTPQVAPAPGPYGGTGPGFGSPSGLALDGAGNLFVADIGAMTVRALALSTGALTTLAGGFAYGSERDGSGYDPTQPWRQESATFASPSGIVFDGVGALYVTDVSGPTVRRVLLADGTTTTVRPAGDDGGTVDAGTDDSGVPAGLRAPQGIVADGRGNVYVADSTSDTIRKVVLATGETTVLAGSPGLPGIADGIGAAARFNDPIGLAADGAGNLFVADSGSATIRMVAVATGAVTTIAGVAGEAGSVLGPLDRARLRAPKWLAYGAGPALYVSDGNAVLVLK